MIPHLDHRIASRIHVRMLVRFSSGQEMKLRRQITDHRSQITRLRFARGPGDLQAPMKPMHSIAARISQCLRPTDGRQCRIRCFDAGAGLSELSISMAGIAIKILALDGYLYLQNA